MAELGAGGWCLASSSVVTLDVASLALNLTPHGPVPPGQGSLPALSRPCGPCPQLVGMRYLHEVLRPVISRVFEEKKYMELDPCKMDLSRAR